MYIQDEIDEMNDKIKMISQQLEQQKEYVAYKEAQLTKNDTGIQLAIARASAQIKKKKTNYL